MDARAGSDADSVKTLLLVPTELERRRLEASGSLEGPELRVETCGFGPVAAAARTALLVERLRPSGVVLIGIAGAYGPSATPLGSAWLFEAVALDGVGAGAGPGRLGPEQLGFPQWPGDDASPAISSRLELGPAAAELGLPTQPCLLTVCAASADPLEAAERAARFAGAAAEDMEAFGVAMVCAMTATPVAVVRGISNLAGERNQGEWCVAEALASAADLTRRLLSAAKHEHGCS
jgi:futalosine hydrolase